MTPRIVATFGGRIHRFFTEPLLVCFSDYQLMERNMIQVFYDRTEVKRPTYIIPSLIGEERASVRGAAL
jgi:hypothetical protein